MGSMDMREWMSLLEKAGELRRITAEVEHRRRRVARSLEGDPEAARRVARTLAALSRRSFLDRATTHRAECAKANPGCRMRRLGLSLPGRRKDCAFAYIAYWYASVESD